MISKKQVVGIAATAVVLAVATAGGCGYAGLSLGLAVLDNRADVFAKRYPVVAWCGNGLPFVANLPEILNRTYLVLLQNSNELRATGGFAGSFAKLEFVKGGLKNITVQDIYEPDGKLPGHVEPPYPIQEAFGQGWWKLRDANWDVDFASAAATVSWFMEQGGEKKVDGVGAVNLGLLKKWIAVLGSVEVITFNEKVTEDNLYSLAQTYAETRTDGEKTEKREFLGALGAALQARTRTASMREMVGLGKLIYDQLNSKQILIWAADPKIQKEVEGRRWDGGLTSDWSGAGDYIYVVDSNLGANKSDCCIERELLQEVKQTGEGITTTVKIRRKNNNEFAVPRPPLTWGGQYIDYVRVIIPKSAVELKTIKVDGKKLEAGRFDEGPASLRQGRSVDKYAIEERGELVIVGFWMTVEAEQTGEAEITFTSRRSPDYRYEVFVKRQPGVEKFKYVLSLDGEEKVKEDLSEDKQFKVKWK